MQVSNTVRPVVRPTVRPATQAAPQAQAPKPAAPAMPVKAQAGGREGFGGLVMGVLLNSAGALSGLLSIRNDMKERQSDTANKGAHTIEVVGDLMNIVAWPLAFIPGVGPAIAGVGQFLGFVTKTTGEMMAGKN